MARLNKQEQVKLCVISSETPLKTVQDATGVHAIEVMRAAIGYKITDEQKSALSNYLQTVGG